MNCLRGKGTVKGSIKSNFSLLYYVKLSTKFSSLPSCFRLRLFQVFLLFFFMNNDLLILFPLEKLIYMVMASLCSLKPPNREGILKIGSKTFIILVGKL